MSQTVKVLLGVLVGMLLICLCSASLGAALFWLPARNVAHGVVREASVRVDPIMRVEPIERAGAVETLTYNVPEGYHVEGNLEVAGFRLTSLNSSTGHGHIYLMRAPAYADLDRNALENELRMAAGDSIDIAGDHVRIQSAGERQVTVCGQLVTMSIGEGTNSDGQPYREMVGVWDGGDGKMLLMFASPVAEWNDAMINAFLASVQC